MYHSVHCVQGVAASAPLIQSRFLQKVRRKQCKLLCVSVLYWKGTLSWTIPCSIITNVHVSVSGKCSEVWEWDWKSWLVPYTLYDKIFTWQNFRQWPMLCIGTKLSPNLISPTAYIALQEVVSGARMCTATDVHMYVCTYVYIIQRYHVPWSEVWKAWTHKRLNVAFWGYHIYQEMWDAAVDEELMLCQPGRKYLTKNFHHRHALAKLGKIFSWRKFQCIRYVSFAV